ncbi:MAG: hypothetical protein RL131_270 [Bacteroidota bacterium]
MSLPLPIYLDYNSTTPCDPQVVETMLPFFSGQFGNASSKSHAYGLLADDAVEQARNLVADLIHAHESEIIFTSGATESINLAIRGLAATAQSRKHIITIATEHKAVLDVCDFLEHHGFEITVLPVLPNGQINLHHLEQEIRKDTLLIAAMYSNNETGVIFPVKEIGEIASAHGIYFVCDATQAYGKLPIDLREVSIDMMAFSGHKIYGPKGVGGLYVRKKDPKIKLQPIQIGGGQERNLRSGTLNVPGIVGLGKASELAKKNLVDESARLSGLKAKLLSGLSEIPGLVVHGDSLNCQSHVVNLGFGFDGGDQLLKMISKHLALSSGSACSSARIDPSHVLRAMSVSEALALASIRFSLGRMTTDSEIETVIDVIKNTCSKILNK